MGYCQIYPIDPLIQQIPFICKLGGSLSLSFRKKAFFSIKKIGTFPHFILKIPTIIYVSSSLFKLPKGILTEFI
ncbi:hypothetical protein AYI68_g2470 [Smittium mucronatum]|uniref:Uncharacterized protein n=1 Tax=Smittium mucronatum TaxID=133383 RepID=A0A1R0H2K8_9FUNG|nr:hypothetical protein AYI68_g2470 [Smittium mucronatum]